MYEEREREREFGCFLEPGKETVWIGDYWKKWNNPDNSRAKIGLDIK